MKKIIFLLFAIFININTVFANDTLLISNLIQQAITLAPTNIDSTYKILREIKQLQQNQDIEFSEYMYFRQSQIYSLLIDKSTQAEVLYLSATKALQNNNPTHYLLNCGYAAYLYSELGEYEKAYTLITEALSAITNQTEPNIVARVNLYAAFVYRNSGNAEKGREFFEKCLQISKNDTLGSNYHVALHEIGNLYISSNPQLALQYQKRALEIRKLNFTNSLIYSYHDISLSYTKLQFFDSAEFVLNESIKLEKMKETNMLPYSFLAFANLKMEQNEYFTALNLLDSALFYNKQLQLKPAFLEIYKSLSSCHEDLHNYLEAFKYLQLVNLYSDSIKSEEIEKQIQMLDARYESAQKDKELSENEVKIQQQQFVLYIFIAIIGGVTMLVFLLYYFVRKLKNKNQTLLIQKQKIEQQNEEIATQKDEIVLQATNLQTANHELTKMNTTITEINRHITDSIVYARRIQSAVLPPQQLFQNFFSEHFIIYQPKDIVSGDFYWIKQFNQNLIFAAADCTGHGVPGAFVSMLAISLLNDITQSFPITTAAEILNNLRIKLKQAFQNNSEKQTKDGMDIALCILNTQTLELQYSGAYNPLYIFNNTNFIEIKANKQPIGNHLKEVPFENHTYNLQKGDTFYLFSDGYIDQFGGENKDKFKAKRFKNLLSDIQPLTLIEQQQLLLTNFSDWKGNIPQLDDMMIIGLRY